MYEIDDIVNKVHCSDCLQFMRNIPDKSIDLIVTSPPYNQKLTTQDTTMILYQDNKKHDEYIDFIRELFKNVHRILNKKGSFFYNYKTNVQENVLFPAFKHLLEANEETKFLISAEIVWNYAGNFDSAKTRFPTDYEMIYQLTKTPDYNFYCQDQCLSSVWNMKHVMANTLEKKECGLHPCPYPKSIIEKIMLYSTKSNDLILDPFLGSGTTAVAAKELGRRFIGIEIEPKYVEIATRRLQQEYLQL